MDGCYLYSGNSQKQAIEACNIIDFFIKHSIFQVESTFEKDEHFPYPVANIGYSELENKWYGWSHIAIFGFGIGDKIKKGNCGYIPDNKENYIERCINFWDSEDFKTPLSVKSEENDSIVLSAFFNDKIPNERLRGTEFTQKILLPKKYGKGEWCAETIEDAKQMAKDFANSVS